MREKQLKEIKKMNVREKFLATMEFDHSTPPPLWEMAYWIETIERWSKEGMTDFQGDDAEENRNQGKVHVAGCPVGRDSSGGIGTIGMEKPMELFPGNYWIYPQNRRQVLEDRGFVAVGKAQAVEGLGDRAVDDLQ